MVTWKEIRAHYAALWRASELTQEQVARRGGLKGQNAISRLLRNTKRGPSVDTLTKAVEGLGLSLVEFFTDLEENRAGAPSLIARVEAIEHALTVLDESKAATTAAARQRRLHDSSAADVLLLPAPGETIGTITLGPAPLDPSAMRDDIERRVVALIRATLDPLIDRLAAHVDPAVPPLRDVDPDPANSLPGRRGSLRKPTRPPGPPPVKELLKEFLKEEIS